MAILVKHFWRYVKLDEICSKYKANLILEKNIYLDEKNDDEAAIVYVLIIGVNPYDKMKVYARIESRIEGDVTVIHLDDVALMDILGNIDTKFGENAVSTQKKKIRSHYKIIIDDDSLKISFSALMTMKKKRLIITEHIRLFRNGNFKGQFYDLLNHFCYEADEELFNQMLRSSHNINKQHLINEMCLINCDCFDELFVLDVANNCTDFFTACIPLFIKAIVQAQIQC